MLVDIEGAEWNVLSTMKSRPKVLCLEMRAGEYKNPNTDKIDRWLEENHYQLWKHHNTDSIYILDSVKLNSPRKFFTTISNSHVLFHHWLKAKRRKLRKKIKKIFRIN